MDEHDDPETRVGWWLAVFAAVAAVLIAVGMCCGCASSQPSQRYRIGQPQEQAPTPMQRAMVWAGRTAWAADIATTWQAGGVPGLKEGNLLLPAEPRKAALVSLALWGLAEWVTRDMEPGDRAAVWAVLGVLHASCAVLNARAIRGHHERP